MDIEKIRLDNSIKDLCSLNAKMYCDLGPGYGELPIELKNQKKNIVVVESSWNAFLVEKWGPEKNIKFYIKDFFLDDFSFFEEEIDCFSLAHCIAHFHLPPQLLFEKIYNKLPKGGYFYLSTVNATSLSRVMKLWRGNSVTEEVTKHKTPTNYTNTYLANTLGIEHHLTVSDWMHVKEYTKQELEKMLISEKFKIVKSFYRNNFTHWKLRLASKFKPHLSEEIIIIVQK